MHYRFSIYYLCMCVGSSFGAEACFAPPPPFLPSGTRCPRTTPHNMRATQHRRQDVSPFPPVYVLSLLPGVPLSNGHGWSSGLVLR